MKNRQYLYAKIGNTFRFSKCCLYYIAFLEVYFLGYNSQTGMKMILYRLKCSVFLLCL